MNIFGFRPFKGRFNLGNSDDIPTNTDGTLIGAVKEIKSDLTANKTYSSNEELVGSWLGSDLYRKCYSISGSTYTSILTLDATLKSTTINPIMFEGSVKFSNNECSSFRYFYDGATAKVAMPVLDSTALKFNIANVTLSQIEVIIYYTKIS